MNIPNLHIFTSTKLRFVREVPLTADVYAFHFKPQKPLKHRAGQAGFLTVPGGGTKFLTLSSSPDDEEAVFATHIHPASTFKQALKRLHPGDAVKFRGPFIGRRLATNMGRRSFSLLRASASPRIVPSCAISRTTSCPYMPPSSTLAGAGIPFVKKRRHWPQRRTSRRAPTNSSDEFWR